MAKILVIEKDPVFAAVLEDRLRVAGHQIEILGGATRAAAISEAADDRHADLVVLDLPAPAAFEAVAALRGRPGTRTVGVAVLSDGGDPAERVAALRAGADEYLARPFDLEELELRMERLLGSRIASLQLLQGDLASHPLWAVLQYLCQVGKSGHLRVRAPGGSGAVELSQGELVAARWQGLHGSEALLALLCAEEGSFRFDEGGGPRTQPPEHLPMNELLMRAAWLKDEMEKRRRFLPATGEPLVAMSGTLLKDAGEFSLLPLQRILSRLLNQPGTRLFDLIIDETEAPLTTRLAVAWLVEHGLIAPRDQVPDPAPQNTMEISNAIVFDVAIADLVMAAAAAGLPAAALPYLVLVEPAVWPELRRLIERAPGFPRNEGLQKLIEQVELRRAGSATFAAPKGKLALHVQVLTAAAQPQIAAIVPSCAGVLVWLDGSESLETARQAVQRLEASALPAAGMLVAGNASAHREAERLAAGSRKWRTSAHAPQSLLGVLRLMHPREKK